MGTNPSSCGEVIADASLLRPIPSAQTGPFPVQQRDGGGAKPILPVAEGTFNARIEDLRAFPFTFWCFTAWEANAARAQYPTCSLCVQGGENSPGYGLCGERNIVNDIR